MCSIIIAGKQSISGAEREVWLREVADMVQAAFIRKYHSGQVEHQGDLGSVPVEQLFTELMQEQLDSIAYMAEIKRRVLTGGYIITTIQTLQVLVDTIKKDSVESMRVLSDIEVAAVKQAENLLSGKVTV